jgi:MGT family glycosyltransferase
MATIAFFNLPARGHLNPTLPVVKELVKLGIDVHYFVGEEYRKLVEDAGSTFHPLPSLNRLGDNPLQSASAPNDKQIALMPFAMGYQAPLVVPELVAVLRTLRPDCLVYNTLSLWPRLAARILDITSIGFRPYHGLREQKSVGAPFSSGKLANLAEETDRRLSALMSSFNKPPLTLIDLVSQVDDLTLMFIVKALQHNAEAFDERFLFVGPSFIEGESEPWPFSDRPDRRMRRAYVSLGTMRNNDPAFYRACFSAFSADEWQVIMSVGEQVTLDSLSPIPDNFLVASSVRQTAVLPHTDVFVTHGGLNSVMESLTFGVPMVIVPSIREQQLTAHRVQALGCGVVLDRDSVTAAFLLQQASAIIDDETIRYRLRTIQEKIVAAGGYKRAATAIANMLKEV